MSRFDEIMERIRTMPADPATAHERLRLLDEADALLPPPNKYQEVIKLAASMTGDPARAEERKQLMAEARQLLAELHPPAPLPVKFVDDAGKPVYTLEQIAGALECSTDEARRKLAAWSVRNPVASATRPIHRLH